MERLFDQTSLIKLLKNGLKEVVNACNGHPMYVRGYQGVKFQNLARVKEPPPPPVEEKVELTNPKDLPTYF